MATSNVSKAINHDKPANSDGFYMFLQAQDGKSLTVDPGVERGRTMVCLQMAPRSGPEKWVVPGSHWMIPSVKDHHFTHEAMRIWDYIWINYIWFMD